MDRTLSDSWTGFKKFTLLNEKPPPGYVRSGGDRLTKIQATTRPGYLWPEIWSDMSNAAQKKEMQEWAVEQPKLDDARSLRGMYFIDPEEGELEEAFFKKPERNWKFLWSRQCPARWRQESAQASRAATLTR